MTYWNGTGDYQTDYDRLYQTLVPMEGNCATVEGENLRAICRIYYDYFNNGFMNNFTGALKWLVMAKLITSQEASLLRPWANSQCPYEPDFSDNGQIPMVLEAIVNRVLEDVLKREAEGFRPNTTDMFILQERDDYRDYDDYND